ncbi:hypothetical protein DSO57_1020564 [Entomophthora muscae]|uniref:Uncharacterized protein n=1 Tax=Entomophthora muscae TaxID=34485 RepID=A0ACC2T3S9_9FUNG|nr:hypothetical protein DSO57_1020564 [Entomophthora muscae]
MAKRTSLPCGWENDMLVVPINRSKEVLDPTKLGRLFFKGKILWFMYSVSAPINMNQIVRHICVRKAEEGLRVLFYSGGPSPDEEFASMELDEATLVEYLDPSVSWPLLKKLTIGLKALEMMSDKLTSFLDSLDSLVIENIHKDDLKPILKKLHCPSIRSVELGVVSQEDTKLIFKSFTNVRSLDLTYRSPSGLELLLFYNCVTQTFHRIQTVINSNSSVVDVWFEHSSIDTLAIRSRQHECMWFHLLMMINFINKVVDGVVSPGPDPLFHLFDITFKPTDNEALHKFLHYIPSSQRLYVAIDHLHKISLPNIFFSTAFIKLKCQTGDLSAFIYWTANYFPSLQALSISCPTNTNSIKAPVCFFHNLVIFEAIHLSFEVIVDVVMRSPTLKKVSTDLDFSDLHLLNAAFKHVTFNSV